ncbi:helix-turn-helix domain-containing protein [Clostridium chromiireducens]|uniref:Helix-turn-helix domain-containing protein n=1 Tax=Clostridium chromiireducens TaxID=225345 RepID=A0A964RPS2_9CLOT|nr:Ada metal-binding domain-containing protein [Clostridium chromiireducens]MVX65583.1 helix-turn-helix domain-containing protein [Clostridium chromiireducens]
MKLTDDNKWNSIINNDSNYDGVFYYGVITTGIFCRPSCKSKEPLRRNVVFFENIEEAYAHGLRPCKRCRPDLITFNPMEDIVKKAKSIYDMNFKDKDRIKCEIETLGISQNRLIELFHKHYDMTPIEYINNLRIDNAKKLLLITDASIVNIAVQCGFGSLSNFYEFFKKQVKQTPNEYRKSKK